MDYKIIDLEKYYRKGVYKHFTEDCKCSTSITSSIDVTKLVDFSKNSGTKFYVNFLYTLSKTLNSREDYKMMYLFKEDKIVMFDKINPAHYVFHDDTETFTVVYSVYDENYKTFYDNCIADIEKAKQTREYGLDSKNHPNWFDASFISWLSYDSLNIELPDGHLFFQPIINWGKYRFENGKYLMPVTVRMNHAIGDGFHISKAFLTLESEIEKFVQGDEKH